MFDKGTWIKLGISVAISLAITGGIFGLGKLVPETVKVSASTTAVSPEG